MNMAPDEFICGGGSNFISNLGYPINEHISLNSVPVLLGLIG